MAKKAISPYPDSLPEITRLACEKLSQRGWMHLEELCCSVADYFPLLTSPIELKSILRGCDDISCKNKMVMLK